MIGGEDGVVGLAAELDGAGVVVEDAGGFTEAWGAGMSTGGFGVSGGVAGFASSSSVPKDSRSSCPALSFIVIGVLQYWHFV